MRPLMMPAAAGWSGDHILLHGGNNERAPHQGTRSVPYVCGHAKPKVTAFQVSLKKELSKESSFRSIWHQLWWQVEVLFCLCLPERWYQISCTARSCFLLSRPARFSPRHWKKTHTHTLDRRETIHHHTDIIISNEHSKPLLTKAQTYPIRVHAATGTTTLLAMPSG